MKKGKKILKGKTKIITALAVAVTFISVLAWYQMKNAHAYGTYGTDGNQHFEEGHLTVNINGPDGKSDSMTMTIHSDDYAKNKNVSGGTFNNTHHPYTITMNTSGEGTYKLRLNQQTVYSEKNTSNNYTLLTIKVWYLLPAHEQHRSWDWVTVDKPTFSDSSKEMTLYCGGDDGFWENSYHDTETHWKTFNIHVTTGLVGLASVDRDGWKTYDWCSINMNLDHSSGKLTFDGNGGKIKWGEYGSEEDSLSKTLSDRDQYGTFPIGARRGYTLTGFNSDPQGNGDWIAEYWQFCDDWKVYAIWEVNTYTISYSGNGEDEGDVSDGTATYDENYTFAKNGYRKKGYAFVGWNTDKYATTAEYSPGQVMKWDKIEGMKLYAIWSKNSYEVTFDGNGASGSKKTADLKYGQNDNLPTNTFERPGYTFIGWSTDPDDIKPKYTDGQTVNTLCDAGQTYELYAIWKKTDGSFDTHNIIRDDGMFQGDVELEGQNKTGFSRDHIDSEYGRIDKDGQPGYFTDRYR